MRHGQVKGQEKAAVRKAERLPGPCVDTVGGLVFM
jgi:hypothetical protein